MGGVTTPERRKLKEDAIRIRQELGWSYRQIAGHLKEARSTIFDWLSGYPIATASDNSNPLALNTVHVMDCVEGTLATIARSQTV